jgi:hypothetical protein
MQTSIVSTIRVTRDHEFYFLTIARNGELATRERIPQQRAKQIVEAHNGNGRTIGHEPVDWTPGGSRQFTWTVDVEDEEE